MGGGLNDGWWWCGGGGGGGSRPSDLTPFSRLSHLCHSMFCHYHTVLRTYLVLISSFQCALDGIPQCHRRWKKFVDPDMPAFVPVVADRPIGSDGTMRQAAGKQMSIDTRRQQLPGFWDVCQRRECTWLSPRTLFYLRSCPPSRPYLQMITTLGLGEVVLAARADGAV